MILYEGTAKEFIDIVETNQIVPTLDAVFRKKLGRKIPAQEIGAYTNSLPYMGRVVRRSGIPNDCGVLIEYNVPLTSYRIDFIIAGEDDEANKNFIIVELKQWQTAEATECNGIVRTFLRGAIRDTPHPSYQAYSYKLFLSDYNELIEGGSIKAHACACLHNYAQQSPEPLFAPPYIKELEEAPIYFRDDQKKLEDFLAKYVNKGRGLEILYQIESGTIKPTKKLIDHVSELFKGNQQFVLLDDQKVAFEKARAIANQTTKKSVVIIKGGPGTGKSVISVNLLGQLLKDNLNAVFVAPNSSFRDVMKKRLAQEHSNVRISNLFKGSAGFLNSDPNTFDTLIVDEAHRLKRKGAYMYQGENQVEDILRACRTAIFFIDDDQSIRLEDVGSVSEIKRIAYDYHAEVHEVELNAQFRCSGAEGYINWLNDVFQIKETANFDGWDKGQFEFKIFSDPNMLREAIKAKHSDGHSARVLAGYAWQWTSAKEGNSNAEIEDVEIPEFDFSMPWNSRRVGTTWAVDQNGINQVGCIHTSQGLEFDYVGVIVGNDLVFDQETLSYKTNYQNYKDSQGKRGLKENPEELNRLVRNIYKILMTRGMKGCYVYFTDKATEEYFRNRIGLSMLEVSDDKQKTIELYDLNDLPENVEPFETALPVYSLKAAAGKFSGSQDVGEEGWAIVDIGRKLSEDMFIARVVGKSMEPRIPDGSFCIFKAKPAGSRQGKIVLAQSREIQDVETGGSYTVKLYESEKVAGQDGEWQHLGITLKPTNPDYDPIVIKANEETQLQIIAEFIGTILSFEGAQ